MSAQAKSADGGSPFELHGLAKWLISLLALAAWLAIFVPAYRLPFRIDCRGADCTLNPLAGAVLGNAVQPGDRVRLEEQPLATRALLIDGNALPVRSLPLVLHRGTRTVHIDLQLLPKRTSGRVGERSVATFVLLFGLLMLWRGESAASRGLSLFALGVVLAGGFDSLPLPSPWHLLARAIGTLMGGPVAFMGLYVTASALSAARLDPRVRRRIDAGYAGVLAAIYLSEVIPIGLLLAGQDVLAWMWVPIVLGAVAWFAPLYLLVRGYRAGAPDSRLRIRWFIASIALLLPVIACNLLLESADGNPSTRLDLLRLVQVLLTVAVFSMLSYAALSQRLVAVRFLANRALVFGLLTAALIGALSLLESLIERSVVSRDAGLALDIAVPLLLGVSIHRIHRWAEEGVERVIFRREYRARGAILEFIRDAGFISQPSVLFERTVAVFAAHAGGAMAALYLDADGGYERAAASAGARDLPMRVPTDDAAMVRLRATRAPLDLYTLASELGATGLALPLVIRGRLEGVLVCGAKAEGRYAQPESEFLAKAATDVAACIIALRAELHGRFVSRAAAGGLSGDALVAEARRLVET